MKIGKSYRTREKNTVKCAESYEEDNKLGVPVRWFTCVFVKAIKGSENLTSPPYNVARWTSEGRWWPKHMAEQPKKSVHDLIEEVSP